jgi:hypothetical protein
MRTMRRKVFMSDLLTRLRQRARLTEYRICGEAAEALEAVLRERDEANRRYHDICTAWLREQQSEQTTHGKSAQATGARRSHVRSALPGALPEP